MSDTITFKPTSPAYEPYSHPFNPAETVEQLK